MKQAEIEKEMKKVEAIEAEFFKKWPVKEPILDEETGMLIPPEISEEEEAAYLKFEEDNADLFERVFGTLNDELRSLQSSLQEINEAKAAAKEARELADKTAKDAQQAYEKQQKEAEAKAALKAANEKAAKLKAERDAAAKEKADAKAKAEAEEKRLKQEFDAAFSADSKLTAK